MTEHDLAAALVRLLEPTTAELSEEDGVVPYWAMSPEARGAVPTHPIDVGFAPGLAGALSDAFADDSHPMPPLADVVAYVDGQLDEADRARFEAALVALPELRAEVDMLFERMAALDEEQVEPAAPFDRSGGDGSRSEPS